MGMTLTYSPSDVRAWAQEAGWPVRDQGRLSYEVVVSYLRAHPKSTRTIAAEYDLEVPARGTLSLAVCEELAYLLR